MTIGKLHIFVMYEKNYKESYVYNFKKFFETVHAPGIFRWRFGRLVIMLEKY